MSTAAGGERAFRLEVQGQTVEFLPQPQAGYVVQVVAPQDGIGRVSDILGRTAGRVERIGGPDRAGLWTVRHADPTGGNREAISALRGQKGVGYLAPLFTYGGQTVAVTPEIVVRLQADGTREELESACAGAGIVIDRPMEFTDREYMVQVLGSDAEAVFGAVRYLNGLACVEWAFPNLAFWKKPVEPPSTPAPPASPAIRIQQAPASGESEGVIPNDEYFPRQWHLHNTGQSGGTPGADIRAPEAWEITTGDPEIIVSVQDNGVASNHPDLVDNLVPGYDFLDGDEAPGPSLEYFGNAHGTACAGLIAACGNNGIGMTGVTWNCKILPVRDMAARADGTEYACTWADDATAVRWEADHGADVLSNSWKGPTAPIPIFYSAIVDVTKAGGMGRGGRGCVMIFAAGNSPGPITTYPQKYPEVIRVGATDHNDRLCWYSSSGPDLDLTAPGGSSVAFPSLQECMRLATDLLWTTDIPGEAGFSTLNKNVASLDYTDKMFGTSAACPIAAGVAALILSVEPNLTNEEVRHYLCRSAKDLGKPERDDEYGWGRVDARAALDLVLAKRADLNNDWVVDENDLTILTAALQTNDRWADIAPATRRDGVVDEQDHELLTRYLGTRIPAISHPSPIAHWKLDEPAGRMAVDSAGGRHGTVLGSPTWQPAGGRVGGALKFDGAMGLVTTPFVLNPSAGPFGVFAWVKGGAPGQVVLSQVGG
ncbi:MAG: S8 family serine peptidase, partial [Planctomycetes bacterium]|nr:S8 family serine peptidase [Planctomycetota bacterium]